MKTKANNIKRKILLILFICIFFLTVGYSTSTTNLGINDISAVIRVQKDIRITSINLVNSSSNAISNWEEYNFNSIMSGISLPNSDSTVTYKVEITNIGNTEATISEISNINNNLMYTISNYNLNDMLCDDNDSTSCKLGSKTSILITIGYAENGYDSENTDYNINLDFTFAYTVDAVAKIGNNYYDTLTDAINAVPISTEETKIELLKSVSECVTINGGKTILLDLKNNILNNNAEKAVITNYGTLTITNGTITTDAVKNGAINNEVNNSYIGNITIDGTRVIVTGGRQALYNNKGIATIKGSSYLKSATKDRSTVQNVAGGKLTILNGIIISEYTNAVQNAGTMTIGNKDSFLNNDSPIMQGADMGINSTTNYNFYDGTARGINNAINSQTKIIDTEDGYDIVTSHEVIDGIEYQIAHLGNGETVTFNPNGGIISNNERIRTVKNGNRIGTLPIPTRKGYNFNGWFTSENNGTIIDENTIIEESITFYAHWTRLGDVAMIGDIKYASIAEAISKTSNSQTTIYLLKNTDEGVTINKGKNIILDLNGFTITNDGNKAIIDNNGNITITNGKITSNADTAAINAKEGIVTIDNMEITATGTRQAVYVNDGTVNITGNSYLSSQSEGIAYETTMERGTIQNLNGIVNIYSGTIINTNKQAISNESTLTIGTKDGNISTTSPVMIGETFGINTTGTLNYYDGIIRGITSSIEGIVSDQEGTITTVIENINNKDYHSTTLN